VPNIDIAVRATWPIHLVIFDLITLIISGEEDKLWSPSFYNFLQVPVTSYLLDPFSAAMHTIKLLGRGWGSKCHALARKKPRTYSLRTDESVFEGWTLPVGHSLHTPSRHNLSVSFIWMETESLWALTVAL
jgi:hypothetical protein